MVLARSLIGGRATRVAAQYRQLVSTYVLEVLHQVLQPVPHHTEGVIEQIDNQDLELAQLIGQLQLGYGKQY